MVDFIFLSTCRVSHERKKENKKHEGRPEDPHSPHGQMLQDTEGVWSTGSKAKEAGEDEAAEERPFLSKPEPRKDVKGLTDSKAARRSCELSPPTTKSFRIYNMNPLSSPNPLPMEKMYPHRRVS
ncbi:hypothetical protein LEMLEM_LOCUS27670 [Lemmus lemmus]